MTGKNEDNSNNFVDSQKTIAKKEFEEQKNINMDILEDSTSELVILPENKILVEFNEEENRFLSTTKEILTILSENGVNASLYDDGRKQTEIVLHSTPIDIVLPYLYMVAEPTRDLIIGIVGAWIYDKFIKREDGNNEEYNITVNFVNQNNDGNMEIRKIKGKPEEVYEALEADMSIKPSLKNPVQQVPLYTEERTKKAAEYYSKAQEEINQGFRKILEEDETHAELIIRSALSSLRQAYLHDNKDKYKNELLRMGNFVYERFGCELEVSEDGIANLDCPVILSDFRKGFSIGATASGVCSICGKSTFECAHLPGRTYDNVVCYKEDRCNICRQENCDHEIGSRYNDVKALNIITKLKGDHIAFVENPLDPSNAVTNIPTHVDRLLKDFPASERKKIYNESSKKLKCQLCRRPN
ncbi:hypothetical protein [Methanobacterium formicicum]|uniref:Uncharacterized protein n=1 Tax=Methanobacterium formicicum (strain DSM 3637 / PP1) TaxID=1204725 RepID=K2RW10_METFP|nr:hypothetical protein [Methanobacterium formicicum]EKF86940.1 hypothetical protein A994_01600 [Methanobacterium formicicum DSM 3637]